MKSNKTFDIKNILVYFVIVLLIFVIALPPIFRLIFKEEKPSIETPTGKALALTCTKKVALGSVNYTIRATSNYTDNNLNKVTLIYKRIGTLDATNISNAVEIEMQNLRSSTSFVATDEIDGTKFVLTKDKVNATDQLATLYFNNLQSQTTLFSHNGYTCQEITS